MQHLRCYFFLFFSNLTFRGNPVRSANFFSRSLCAYNETHSLCLWFHRFEIGIFEELDAYLYT